MSDLHIGSAETRVDKIKEELHADDAWLLFNGDGADAIIASDSKRFVPSCLAKRLRGRNDIINATIDWQCELLEPVKHRILGWGVGNHETAIEKHCSVDMAKIVCDRLGIPYAGYTGFYDFRFRNPHGNGCRYLIHYHHGAGGGSSLSACATEFTKRYGYISADLIWVSHRHHNMTSGLRRLECPLAGSKLGYKDTRFLMTAAYMEAWAINKGPSRHAAYAEDRALPPQMMGGAVVEVTPTRNGPKLRVYT